MGTEPSLGFSSSPPTAPGATPTGPPPQPGAEGLGARLQPHRGPAGSRAACWGQPRWQPSPSRGAAAGSPSPEQPVAPPPIPNSTQKRALSLLLPQNSGSFSASRRGNLPGANGNEMEEKQCWALHPERGVPEEHPPTPRNWAGAPRPPRRCRRRLTGDFPHLLGSQRCRGRVGDTSRHRPSPPGSDVLHAPRPRGPMPSGICPGPAGVRACGVVSPRAEPPWPFDPWRPIWGVGGDTRWDSRAVAAVASPPTTPGSSGKYPCGCRVSSQFLTQGKPGWFSPSGKQNIAGSTRPEGTGGRWDPGWWPGLGPSRLGFLPQHCSRLQNLSPKLVSTRNSSLRMQSPQNHIRLAYAESAPGIPLEAPSPLPAFRAGIFDRKS